MIDQVVDYLKKKYNIMGGTGTAESGTENAAAAAETAAPPTAQPAGGMGFKQALGVGLAGLGDAYAARVGKPGTAAKDAIESIREAPVRSAAREKLARESSENVDFDNTESETSKIYQGLAEKYTKQKPGSYTGLSATKIKSVMPILEKAYEADVSAETRKQISADSLASREAMINLAQSNRVANTEQKQGNVAKEAMTKKFAIELPKMKEAATSASRSQKSVDLALSLVDKGVTGKGGQLKAFLAPYAEFAGVNTEGMDDAQKFQLLTRAIIGPMRLDIIGPGPVSEWEQKLMQQLSGSGGAVKEAARELLTRYRDLALDKVNSYNEAVASAIQLSPDFGIAYTKMDIAPAGGGLTGDKKARLEELRKKKAEGTLGTK